MTSRKVGPDTNVSTAQLSHMSLMHKRHQAGAAYLQVLLPEVVCLREHEEALGFLHESTFQAVHLLHLHTNVSFRRQEAIADWTCQGLA